MSAASTCTYDKPTENKCHFLSHRATLSLSVSTSSLSFYHPVPTPPSLPRSLPSHLLPPSAVAFCQSAHPPGGEFDPSLFNSPSLLPPSLSRSQSAFPFSCSLSVDSPLSHRSGLHYLPSSPSSKMTFSDFTKARQFDSVKSPQSRGEREKRETRVMSDVTGQKETVSSVIHHHRSASRGY